MEHVEVETLTPSSTTGKRRSPRRQGKMKKLHSVTTSYVEKEYATLLTTTNGPFATLLPEILELIFSFLDVVNKGRVACVCRHWKRVCYSKFLWEVEEAKLDLHQTSSAVLKSIQFRGISRIQILSFNSNFTTITSTFRNLKSLRLRGCYNTTDAALRKAFPERQAFILPSLKECDLSLCKQITDQGLEYVLTKAPNIEKLNLAGCVNITNRGLKICCSKCKDIRYLDLSGCKLINCSGLQVLCDSDGMTDLRELYLQGCTAIRNSGLFHISRGLVCLETLVLSFCSEISNEGIIYIASGVAGLKRLCIRGCKRIGEECMESLAQGCPNLESLDVSFCHRINDNSLGCLAQGLTNLKSLQLSACNISDSGILALVQSLQHLQHLSIGQCERLTDKSLAYIAEYFCELQSIDVYGCTKMTADGMKLLLSRLYKLKKLSLSLT